MLELGEAHDEGHRAVGEAAAADGRLARRRRRRARPGIAEGAVAAGLDAGRVIRRVADADAALDALRPRLRDGDVVLVKASRGIGLDRLVDGLRARARPRRRRDR